MTSSAEAMPSGLSSIWRLCRLGYHNEPQLFIIAFLVTLLGVLPDTLIALWLKVLANGVLAHHRGPAIAATIGLAISAAANWLLRTIGSRARRRFRDKVSIALESHVARLQASVVSIAHYERPEYLDRLAMLRDQVFVLDHTYWSVFTTCGWILRLGVTIALLASVQPRLVVLALFAIPTVWTSSWRAGIERRAQEEHASSVRLVRHLFTLSTAASAGKEVRVAGIARRLFDRRCDAWERWYAVVCAARTASAAWHAVAWLIFGVSYVGALVTVASSIQSSAGDVLLVLAAGARLSAYVSATVSEIGFLRGIWMDGARRLAWFEDYASSFGASADIAVPDRLTKGICFDHVSFVYPGTDRVVLDNVSLMLPAGAVVGIIGDNGAGKTTLVKLLARMYEPSAGTILVDGHRLARMPAEEWRRRLAGAFQDFFRFEFRASQSIGIGDVPKIDDGLAINFAIERAGAADVISHFPSGLDTQLGPTWPAGIDVSFGQWQKIALARGFMRREPLVLVLDEPTAALDAETEHALFERYAATARRSDRASVGTITIFVSHRLSTVQMADLIVVLDGAQVVELGRHDELVARGGTYAELYRIQAASYS